MAWSMVRTYIRRWAPCYKTVICNEILIRYVNVQWNHLVNMWFLTVSNMNHRFYEWSNDYEKSICKNTGRRSQVFACENDAAFEQYCMQNSLTVTVNIKILQPISSLPNPVRYPTMLDLACVRNNVRRCTDLYWNCASQTYVPQFVKTWHNWLILKSSV